jgi:hypothetical protein
VPRLHREQRPDVVAAPLGLEHDHRLARAGGGAAELRVEVQRVVGEPVDRLDADVVVQAVDHLARPVLDGDARAAAERHRPVAVVAAAGHVERRRREVAPLAEAHPEEVRHGHLHRRLGLVVPVRADDELPLDGDVVPRGDREPPASHGTRAAVVDERQRLAGGDAAEVVVPLARVVARVVREAAGARLREGVERAAGRAAGRRLRVGRARRASDGSRGAEGPHDEGAGGAHKAVTSAAHLDREGEGGRCHRRRDVGVARRDHGVRDHPARYRAPCGGAIARASSPIVRATATKRGSPRTAS